MDTNGTTQTATTMEWLRQGKELVISILQRLQIQRDLCPLMCSESDRPKLLAKLAALNTDICI